MRRFEYDRIDPESLREFLDRMKIGHQEFARMTDTNPQTVKRWLSGKQDVPHWVALLVALLERAPDLSQYLRFVAWELVRFDNQFPERGEYPYSALKPPTDLED